MHLNCFEKTTFKIADAIDESYDGRFTKVSKTSPQNSLENVKNQHDKEIPKGRYVFPEERQKVIDALRLM